MKKLLILAALLATTGAKADGGIWNAAVKDDARPVQLAGMLYAGTVAEPLPLELDNDLARRGLRRQPAQQCFVLAMPSENGAFPTDTLVCQGALEAPKTTRAEVGSVAEIAKKTHADLGRLEAGDGPVTAIFDMIRGWPECNERACKTDFKTMIPPGAEIIAKPDATDNALFFFRAKVGE